MAILEEPASAPTPRASVPFRAAAVASWGARYSKDMRLLGLSGGFVAAACVCLVSGCCGGAECITSQSSVVLNVTGYVITNLASSCPGASIDGGSVSAMSPQTTETCTFRVTLDDGEVVSFGVPFTVRNDRPCCNTTYTYWTPDGSFTPLTVTAPPGYVPHLDGGTDAAVD